MSDEARRKLYTGIERVIPLPQGAVPLHGHSRAISQRMALMNGRVNMLVIHSEPAVKA